MEGLLQAFTKEIAIATVGGLLSTLLFARAPTWLRAALAGMVAITLAAATYYFVSLPSEQRLQRCETAWATAQAEHTIGDYRGFLDGCPNSEYTGLARAQIRGLCESDLDRSARDNDVEALDIVRHDCSDTPVADQAQRLACRARWLRASQDNTRDSYAQFQRDCPQGEYPVAERLCELSWAESVQRDTVEAYAEFQQACNESPRIAELNERRCAAHWRQANAADEIRSYRTFLDVCGASPEAMHATARISAICDIQWSQAREARALPDYQRFLHNCPESPFRAQEIERVEDQCDALWRRTQRRDRVAQYEEFLRTCPGTSHAEAAQFQLIRATSDKITRNYALDYEGCRIHVRPDLSPAQQQDAIEDATRECRRQAERNRRGPGPSLSDTILAVIIGVCAAGGC